MSPPLTEDLLRALGAEPAGDSGLFWHLGRLTLTAAGPGSWNTAYRAEDGSNHVLGTAASPRELVDKLWKAGTAYGAQVYRDELRATLRDLLGLDNPGVAAKPCE